MYTLGLVFLCFQACFLQCVFSQCAGQYRPGSAIAPGLAPFGGPAIAPGYGPLGYGLDVAPSYGNHALGYGPAGYGFDVAAYGGTGVGNVAVAGELPVGGTAVVGGQVPIIGAVEFGGPAAAAGAVYITGNCGCGCGAPYGF